MCVCVSRNRRATTKSISLDDKYLWILMFRSITRVANCAQQISTRRLTDVVIDVEKSAIYRVHWISFIYAAFPPIELEREVIVERREGSGVKIRMRNLNRYTDKQCVAQSSCSATLGG